MNLPMFCKLVWSVPMSTSYQCNLSDLENHCGSACEFSEQSQNRMSLLLRIAVKLQMSAMTYDMDVV